LETTNATNQTDLFPNRLNSLQKSQISFSELIVEKKIGTGGYGKVCLGKWNAAPVALKFCKKKGKIEDFMKEIKLMMYVSI
jgi:serine/threonine protein kinase